MKVSCHWNKKETVSLLIFLSFFIFVCCVVTNTSLVFAQASTNSFSEQYQAIPHAFFTKTLSLGSYNEEVVLLKYILGQSADTTSASTELPLAYFGPKTKEGVIRFQEAYAQDILLPLGLQKGTGIVAGMTRKKLNELIHTISVSPNSLKSDSGADISTSNTPIVGLNTAIKSSIPTFTTQIGPSPRLFRTNKYQVAPGTLLTLEGKDLPLEGNTVIIGNTQVSNLISDGNNLSFTIPRLLPYGDYVLSLVDKNGKKALSGAAIHILVTGNPQLPPVITSVTPAEAFYTGIITVKGEHFTPSNNTLVTGFGTVSGLSSTNDTIILDLKNLPSLVAIAANPNLNKAVQPMWMYVQNSNGTSEKEFDFSIKTN